MSTIQLTALMIVIIFFATLGIAHLLQTEEDDDRRS